MDSPTSWAVVWLAAGVVTGGAMAVRFLARRDVPDAGDRCYAGGLWLLGVVVWPAVLISWTLGAIAELLQAWRDG